MPGIYKISIILFVGLFFLVSAFADDKFDQSLGKAREYVEDKNYSAALEEYSSISSELGHDSGLLIEWARVYTYADRHEEAIKVFEEIRQKHPQRAAEILKELADQYKWNGQLKKSIEIYKEALKTNVEDLQVLLGLAQALLWADDREESLKIYERVISRWPDNNDALLGKADILSFQDKLEEADGLYQKVLDKDPENIAALNAQARILVWKGYHRRGIARYEQILQKYPKNPDALEGMAFALHWSGQDLLAVDRLKELFEFEPNRKEAKDLYSQIQDSQYPFTRVNSRFSNDSTPQTISTEALRSGAHLTYSASLDVIYENQLLRKRGTSHSKISADRGGLFFNKSFGNAFEFNTFMYGTHFNKVKFNPFTTNTWFTYKPDDCWRFDLAYDRETFEDNDALVNRIITNSPSLSLDFRPDRFWFFNIKYKRSYYTDENRQNQIFSKIEYRLAHKPYVKLYYNYYYSDWGEPELSHGYFNPRRLISHMLGAYSGIDLTNKLFIEAKASGGYEFQRKPDVQPKKSDHPVCYAAASLSYRLTNNWLVSASGDFFSTWPDHGQRSYQKRNAYLSVTYNFGASPVAMREGTRPSRVTGGN